MPTTLPGKRADYTPTAYPGGVYLKSKTWGQTVMEGEGVFFRDEPSFIVIGGNLVGGTVAGTDPRVAELQAKIADLKAKLQAIVNGL